MVTSPYIAIIPEKRFSGNSRAKARQFGIQPQTSPTTRTKKKIKKEINHGVPPRKRDSLTDRIIEEDITTKGTNHTDKSIRFQSKSPCRL
jgi:hypothetical protein